LTKISKIFILSTEGGIHMKKMVLIIIMVLFVAGNLTALMWGGFDPGQVLAKDDCN